jgi:hypothetical protein
LKSFSLDLKLTVGIWYFAPGGVDPPRMAFFFCGPSP